MLSQIMRAVLVTAALIFASGVNAAPINPQILSQIAALIEQRRRDPRFGMRRKEAMAIFGIGLTRVMTLEVDGEVETYLDGANRMITVNSVYVRQIALLLLANPISGPAPKARLPAKLYQPRRLAPPTEADLEALRKGNEGRALAAARKREAKAARVCDRVTDRAAHVGE